MRVGEGAAALAVFALGSSAEAHQRPEERRLFLTVDATTVEAVLVYVPATSSTATIDAIDVRGDHTFATPWERLAAAQLLVPAALSGVELRFDGAPAVAQVRSVAFDYDATATSPWSLVVGLSFPVSFDTESCATLRLSGAQMEIAAQFGATIRVDSGPQLSDGRYDGVATGDLAWCVSALPAEQP